MQIRLGNRQDETKLRSMVDSVLVELNQKLDLEGTDSDLKNVEANYFGKNGVFLIAEDDREIVGCGGARQRTESVLELVRLVVVPSKRRSGLGREMLATIKTFGRDLDYLCLDCYCGSNFPDGKSFLLATGFTEARNDEGKPMLRTALG